MVLQQVYCCYVFTKILCKVSYQSSYKFVCFTNFLVKYYLVVTKKPLLFIYLHFVGKEGGAGAPTNPIGKIQEYCVKFSLPLPIYDLQNTIGQPHQRNFEIIAKVGSVNAIGSGTSKKDAKRSAASALLAKLKAMGNDVTSLSNIIPPANGTANSVGKNTSFG